MRISLLPVAFLLIIALPITVFGQAPPALQPLVAPPVPAQNPQTPAKIALGQALFWDEQLSVTGTVACGTCHAPRAGGADPRSANISQHPGPDGIFGNSDDVVGSAGVSLHGSDGVYQVAVSFGMRPQVGNRQSMAAINAAYPSTLFWDGRAAGLLLDPANQQTLIANGAALENQALGPLVNSAEMAHAGGSLVDMQLRIASAQPLALATNVPASLSTFIGRRGYPELFAEVFGSSTITAAQIAMAIASYERSLVGNQTPLDADLTGTPSLSPLENQGRQVFLQAGCNRCHGGALLSDDSFHYTGVRPQAADAGRFAVTGLNADRGRMRTPTLRNIELTAPYMADGRLATLEDVIDFYARGGDFNAANRDPRITPINLNPGQRAALAAFMRRPLTDPRVLAQSGPFERPQLFSESSAVPVLTGSSQAGSGGLAPRLIAVEPPLANGNNFTVAVEKGLASASATLLLDLIEPSSPVAANLLSRTFALSATGDASLNITLPSEALLAGQDLYVRVFVADPAASGGFSATQSARFRLLGVSADVFANGFE